MNGRDLIAVLEYAKTFGKEKETRKTKKVMKDPDFFVQLMEHQQNMDKFQKWLKDQEKLNKKEDKKPDPGMSVIHVAMFTILLSAMSGPFYFWMFGRMAGKW